MPMHNRDIITLLSMTDLLDALTPAQLELIAPICEIVTLREGEVLFEENDSSKELYVIVRGAIEILVNPGLVGLADDLPALVVTELRSGQIFGEVALVDQGLRSATARATQDRTELLAIPRERLMRLCDTYPQLGYRLMRSLAADLALKMRHTDLTVRQLQLMLTQNR